jgi:hypothetical protein
MPGPFIYQSNIPAANDELSVSQGDIQQNFASIKNIVDINHVTFSSPDAGKHKFITFSPQNPVPVFAGTDEGMFSVATIAGPNPTINGPEIFLKKFYDSGTLNFNVPFTASVISNTPFAQIINAMTQGWSYLPSGILLKWGLGTINGNAVTFPVDNGIPAFRNCFTVVATPVSSATTFAVTTVTSLNFTTTALANNFQVMYLAIGY